MKKELLEMLEKLETINDVEFFEEENVLSIDFNDFVGFDEEWNEIYRDYENKELVDKVLNFLEKNCKSQEHDFYDEFIFDDFVAVVGYSSYNI